MMAKKTKKAKDAVSVEVVSAGGGEAPQPKRGEIDDVVKMKKALQQKRVAELREQLQEMGVEDTSGTKPVLIEKILKAKKETHDNDNAKTMANDASVVVQQLMMEEGQMAKVDAVKDKKKRNVEKMEPEKTASLDNDIQKMKKSLQQKRVAELRKQLKDMGEDDTTGTKPILIEKILGMMENKEDEVVKRQKVGSEGKIKMIDDPTTKQEFQVKAVENSVHVHQFQKDVEPESGNGAVKNQSQAVSEMETELEEVSVKESHAVENLKQKEMAPSEKHFSEENKQITRQNSESIEIEVNNLQMFTRTPKQVEDALLWLFSHYGTVVDVELVKNYEMNSFGGSAVVKMATQESADAAVSALHLKYSLEGSSECWSVQARNGSQAHSLSQSQAQHEHFYSIEKSQRTQSHACLFINNLHESNDEKTIKSVFEPFGKITEIRIFRDRETRKSRGMCVIRYMEREEAESAMNALNGVHTMSGASRPLVIKWDRHEGGGVGNRGGGLKTKVQQHNIRESVHHASNEKYSSHTSSMPYTGPLPVTVMASNLNNKNKNKKREFEGYFGTQIAGLPPSAAVEADKYAHLYA